MSLVAERGIALLIVVSILTVVGIMGVAFAFSLHLETQATREFVSTTQARYIAEGGVSHARALLDEDRLGTRIDALSEAWADGLQGGDVDVDGDGVLDARWLPIANPANTALGRYALRITDESGKANLNMALADPSDTGLGAIDLTAVLEAAEIGNASSVAERIEEHRYGADGRPGAAGEDDDGDGAIDETDEYQPMALRGDDRRLETLEDLAMVAELDGQEIRHLSRFASVYARDLNITATGVPRINVNTATAEELLSVWLKVGAGDPWRMAVNMADAVDPDLAISRVSKSSSSVMMGGGGSMGSWTWNSDPVGHYASDETDGAPLTWTAQVPTGTFYVLVRGVPGLRVGEVTLAGQTHAAVEDGDSVGLVELSNGILEVEVAHREPAGTECAFRGLVLVPEQSTSGIAVRGIEAVRFNELMIDPELDLPVSSATFDAQGSDWGCPIGSDACQVSGVGQARWSWTNPALQPGRYYVRVFAQAPGQTVGEVRVDGDSQLLVHGQSHPRTVGVGSDGKITLTIGKTASEGTYYLTSVQLSLQPDGEYVELINLSDEDLDVGGWIIDGELTGGRQGRLPSGTIIESHGVLVAAVDLDDAQPGLSSNGIDARSAWAIPDDVPAVQLEFLGGGPSQDDDWLKSSVPNGATRLLLRHDETVVDEIEYALPPPTTAAFQSLEKGDPTVIVDEDEDGVDEAWYPSLKLYTPGMTNDNNGLRELDGLEVILHDPAEEVVVLNRPLRGVGELAGVPSGEAWAPLAVADLARVADLFTVEGLQLEPSGRIVAGEGAWQEMGDGSYAYSSLAAPAVVGTWQWHDVPQGPYRLSVYGWPGERLAVRWQQRDDTWTDWSPDLSTDAQGRLVIGQITIGPPSVGEGADVGTRDYTLTFEARCASQSGVCHLDHIGLDPRLIRLGAVNVNTAPREVLLALPDMTAAKVDRLIEGRPYGDRDEKGRGIGDLLLGDALGTDDEEKLDSFRRLGHLLTTHSDTFQIMSLGQATQENKVRATQRILTVVER